MKYLGMGGEDDSYFMHCPIRAIPLYLKFPKKRRRGKRLGGGW